MNLPNGKNINIRVNEQKFRLNDAFNCTDSNKPAYETDFYFRMNDLGIWYAATKTDINVLG